MFGYVLSVSLWMPVEECCVRLHGLERWKSLHFRVPPFVANKERQGKVPNLMQLNVNPTAAKPDAFCFCGKVCFGVSGMRLMIKKKSGSEARHKAL